MPSSFLFCVDNGAAIGNPARGTTRTSGISNLNWKNIDDAAASYANYPIVAGNNSFDQYIFGVWTGSFNSISSVVFQHVSGILNPNLYSLYTFASGANFYQTPSINTNTSLIHNLTNTGILSTGIAIRVGEGADPQIDNKGVLTTGIRVDEFLNSVACTEYIGTQLRTSAASPVGDYSESIVFQIQWTES